MQLQPGGKKVSVVPQNWQMYAGKLCLLWQARGSSVFQAILQLQNTTVATGKNKSIILEPVFHCPYQFANV